MKILFAKLFFIIVIISSIEYCVSYFIRVGIFGINVINLSVFHLQHKSKAKHIAKVLVIGDSVGEQLYGSEIDNDKVCSLASNQGVTIAGYFFLVNNYLKINTPKDVYLLVCPNTLQNQLSKVSYNYFLKPFYTSEYKPLMNKQLHDAIKDVPNYWMCQWPAIFSTSYTPEYEIDKVVPISDVSASYVDSLSMLCTKKGVKFHLRICPLRNSVHQEVERYGRMFDKGLYKKAFSEITYFPDSCFVDGTHLKHEFVPNDYLKINE